MIQEQMVHTAATSKASSQATLQLALLANGTFSGLSGFASMMFASRLNVFMGSTAYVADGLFVALGAMLALYALLLYTLAMQARISTLWTRVAIALDVGWVVGSFGLLGQGASILTEAGQSLILALALVVGGLAVAQWIGLKQTSEQR